jgi:hypothetical protein
MRPFVRRILKKRISLFFRFMKQIDRVFFVLIVGIVGLIGLVLVFTTFQSSHCGTWFRECGDQEGTQDCSILNCSECYHPETLECGFFKAQDKENQLFLAAGCLLVAICCVGVSCLCICDVFLDSKNKSWKPGNLPL